MKTVKVAKDLIHLMKRKMPISEFANYALKHLCNQLSVLISQHHI